MLVVVVLIYEVLRGGVRPYVPRGGSVVQDDNAWAYQRTGDGQALTLTTRRSSTSPRSTMPSS